MAIIRDRVYLDEFGSPTIELLKSCFKEHQNQIERFNKLKRYYDGDHDFIKNRKLSGKDLPNNKLVCNHAEYITDIATGYFMGNPVKYSGDSIKPMENVLKSCSLVDTELSRDISKYGIGYELIYMSSDLKPIPKSTNIEPVNMFLVVDDTVEYKSMFAVHYYPKKKLDGTLEGYYVNVYTSDSIEKYLFKNLEDTSPQQLDIEVHYFGQVPVIEYWNKSNLKGDFEGVISLIDAYDLLQSDRVNDKEQLVDSLLTVIGGSLGDDEEEITNTAKLIKRYKLLELPPGADAKWLIKQLVETEVEVLKKAIKDDIHEFSKVPCLTDENFASQSSGVAMKYKLFGLEQLAKTKEGYYRMGLLERLQIYANIYNIKGNNIDISDVTITMTRSLPVNEVELSTMVTNLEGTVSLETRLGLLPFVSDVDEEIKKVKKEKQEAYEQQQKAFSAYNFNTSDEVDGDDKVNED